MSHFDDEDTQKRATISTFTSEHARITKERALERQQAQSVWYSPDQRSLRQIQESIEDLLQTLPSLGERTTGPLQNDQDNDGEAGELACV